MAEQSIPDQQSALEEPGKARASSRRQFLKKAGLAAAVLVPAGVAGGALGTAAASAAPPKEMSAVEREALRQRFLDQARAAVQEAHSLAASASEQLPEAALANLADPSGQRAVKLQAAVPRPPAAPRQAAAVASPIEQNVLVRMQQDLQRALQKPIDQRRWAMAIDLRKCIGCSACTVACKAENKLPPGVVYRPVVEEEVGSYPNVSRRFTPRPCMQCENPPCVPVCPVGATYQRPDGIVEIDYNACIGCRYCIAACPYGARTFDWGENYTDGTPRLEPYEQKVSFEYGQSWSRENGQSPVGNVRKCQFCVHRLEAGMLPACTTTCVGGATYFGDANDPKSLVSELISRPNTMRLKEELGTRPKVYYVL